MKRILPFLLILLLGCTTVHENFKYGGAEEDMTNGMSIYHQLELSYVENVKGKDLVIVKPMPLDKRFVLPESTNGLAIGVYVKNTREVSYEIWENYEILYDNNTEPYYIKRKLENSRLPDMVRSVILPRYSGTEVIYTVEIVSEGGQRLFVIGDVKYYVGVKK